jgi:hypothetical protein
MRRPTFLGVLLPTSGSYFHLIHRSGTCYPSVDFGGTAALSPNV